MVSINSSCKFHQFKECALAIDSDAELINTYRYPTNGIIGAIAKPFVPNQLVDQVTQYLDRAKGLL